MAAVLGVDPLDPHWRGSGTDTSAEHAALGALVADDLDLRATAKAAKDWATADRIRDRLAGAGVQITDTPDGPEWSIAAKDVEK